MKYSIRHVCQRSKLSRSTLLYYDSIGLLKPSGRTAGNYRIYTEDDIERLDKICMYRDIGLCLDDIKAILYSQKSDTRDVLEKRINELNREIQNIKIQQRAIAGMLKDEQLLKKAGHIGIEKFVDLMRSAGIDDDSMDRMHAVLEQIAPEFHQSFLEMLDIDRERIEAIREHSREYVKSRHQL